MRLPHWGKEHKNVWKCSPILLSVFWGKMWSWIVSLCCDTSSIVLYFLCLCIFFISVSCRGFANITTNENIIQIIPIFSKIECCFHIKFFSSYTLWPISEQKFMSQVLYFYSLIIVSDVFGMISWNTQIRDQLLPNFYAYRRGHCMQIWCYNSLDTCTGVNICHPKERETICYVVYVKHLGQHLHHSKSYVSLSGCCFSYYFWKPECCAVIRGPLGWFH